MIIRTIADIKRIPVGTKLYIIASLLGSNAPKGRIVKKVRSADIIMTVDDPTSKNHGGDSYLSLNKVRVETTENGFRLIEKEDNQLCAEYVFSLPV